MVWMTSHLFQLARVAATCSGVEVPNTKPWIFFSSGASVMSDTKMTTKQQTTSMAPQKNNQLKS